MENAHHLNSVLLLGAGDLDSRFRFCLILFSSAKLLIENDLRKKSNKRLISNIFWPLECQQMQTWCRMLTVLLQKAWKHVL